MLDEAADCTTEAAVEYDDLGEGAEENLTALNDLAWVDGIIKTIGDKRVHLIATFVDEDTAEPTAPAQPVNPLLVPPSSDDQIVGHSTNFVNEWKISDFKLVLTINGNKSFELANSSEYAIRKSSSSIKLFKNFKEKKSVKLKFGAKNIFVGALLGVKSVSGLAFFDCET